MSDNSRTFYIITGPTSGIGQSVALELANHANIILVGRSRQKLENVKDMIVQTRGKKAIPVVCDFSEPESVKQAAKEIIDLQNSGEVIIAGLLNNAGMSQAVPTQNSLGWDLTFATDHMGPFLFTELLIPHLRDGTNVVFVASGVEDPERKPAVMAGFRGGRYISVEASARGEWLSPGGSTLPGGDSYATSKQCSLVTALELARETPRLHINALEPGFIPNTDLFREASGAVRFVAHHILPMFAPYLKYWSTKKRAGQVATQILIDKSAKRGLYFNENGLPMRGSKLAHDPKFAKRVVSETRALLAQVPN
jgi:NAD(P)-dependent dehydrogenase (short-subunit alcohol dehydrogenase family)